MHTANTVCTPNISNSPKVYYIKHFRVSSKSNNQKVYLFRQIKNYESLICPFSQKQRSGHNA